MLDRAHVDARIPDRSAGEDQAAAFDLELAAVGRVIAGRDIEFTGRMRDLVVAGRMFGDPAAEPRLQSHTLDRDIVAERHGHIAGDLVVIRGRRSAAADHHLVGGGQHGVRQIRWRNACARNPDFTGNANPVAIDLEGQIRRGVDLCLRYIGDAQLRAAQCEFAMGHGFAPFESSAYRRMPPAELGTAVEVEPIALQSGFERGLAHRQVDLIQIELAVRQ